MSSVKFLGNLGFLPQFLVQAKSVILKLCRPGGRLCRFADCSGWPTVPDGRLYRVADCTGWPTVQGGRSNLM
uniref:Uncharacterized protein n=1 Tax=Romanomermis culicivorax TaxID=13658 RepID=A0A915KTJ9_ROMCU